jgi:Arc/MetJ-type ribon-helix-helix transcriptional regulator
VSKTKVKAVKAVTLTVSVPANWVDWLEREAHRRNFANRSELVREALRRMLSGDVCHEHRVGTVAA